MSPTIQAARRTATPLPLPADAGLARIRGEYRDMPGLQLTPHEAARLLGLDAGDCDRLLEELTHAGFLRRRERGRYVLATER
jgi:DNA-binding IclR family transcriptional regulator